MLSTSICVFCAIVQLIQFSSTELQTAIGSLLVGTAEFVPLFQSLLLELLKPSRFNCRCVVVGRTLRIKAARSTKWFANCSIRVSKQEDILLEVVFMKFQPEDYQRGPSSLQRNISSIKLCTITVSQH